MPSRWLAALCCFGVTLGSGAAFGGNAHPLLYPPQVRARPVVVATGGPWRRRYWDPRYEDFACPVAASPTGARRDRRNWNAR